MPRPLLVVLVLGVAVRAGLFVLLPDGILHNNDSAAYLSNGFFWDPRQPSGYYFLLAWLRYVDDALWPIYLTQHLLGLGAGVLTYLAAREAGLAPLPAALAATPLLLGSEMLYLERAPLSDSVFVVQTTGVLYLALRSLRGGIGWLIGLGALLGCAAITRSIGVPLAIVVCAWLVLAAPGVAWRGRLRIAAAAAVPVLAIIGGYQLAANASGKPYDGMSDLGGRYAYARVAQFADCSKFTPPKGTRPLCDPRPSRDRPGARFYAMNPASPVFKAFPVARDAKAGDAEMAEFAARAIRAQPIDYATTVLTDLARYVRADVERRPDAGNGAWALDLSLRYPSVEALVARFAQAKYPGVAVPRYRGAKALAFYSTATVIAAPVLLALVALTLVAVVRRAPQRRAAVLCLLIAGVMMVVPVATLIYNQRYAVPAYSSLALAGMIGACGLLGRGLGPPAWLSGRPPTRAASEPPPR